MSAPVINILGTRGIPAAHGGFETFAQALALDLAGQGRRVRVYCQHSGRLARAVRNWRGVELVEITVPGDGAVSTMLFDLLSTLDAIRQRGVVLTCGYNTSPLFVLYRMFGKRNVVNMDGVEWRRRKWGPMAKAWLWCCERIAMRLASEVVADHPQIARHLLRMGRQRIVHVIPYGVPTPPPVDARVLAAHGLTEGRYAILVARPEPENSILEVIEAWSSRPRGMPLVVVGDYEDSATSWHEDVRRAAGEEVLFIGEVWDRDALASLRRGGCLYIHGHTVGGTNPSALEALAAGNPVLAHDNPYNRWVLADAAIYFLSPESCVRGLDRVLGSEQTRAELSARAVQLAAERFSLEACHRSYLRLLLPGASGQ